MKKLILLIFTVLIPHLKAFTFHIVGGEMELVHIEGNRYSLRLIQYFDEAQNQNPGPEPSLFVYIFKNSNNTLVRTEQLTLQSRVQVDYTNPECAIGSLLTSRVLYSKEIILEPEIFYEEEGYYASWERCCRNVNIANIAAPSLQGMIYTIDFPPVVKEGVPFINSSPRLFPPLSDYACVNQLYYTNFAGFDSDGDSIVYSLQNPLNSPLRNNNPVPIPRPKPFLELEYSNGTDINNIIPGDPSLHITPDGYLTVKPANVGLYVFSVMVEEYRDHKKIGELRRDFQMLVVDGCDPPTPPHAEVRLPGQTGFYDELEVIHYSASEEKCFEYLVIDQAGENVTLKAEGVNFDEDVSDIFSITSGPIDAAGDTLRVEVCIAECPYIQNEPYVIDLIASDNACPLPQRDTVRMTISVEVPPNNRPYFESPPSNIKRIRSQREGQDIAVDELLIGKDADMDSLRFYFYAEGFDPVEYGMRLDTLYDELGEKRVNFNWNTSCDIYDFSEKSTFELGVVLEDYDTCSFDTGDTLFYALEVILPANTRPEINGASSLYNQEIRSQLSLDISSVDLDNDHITLRALGKGFKLDDVGASFENVDGNGHVKSKFLWDMSCENLNIETTESYTIYFVSEDDDFCKITNQDTLKMVVNVIVPVNNKPVFEIENRYSLSVNEEFVLDVVATDVDSRDLLTLVRLTEEAQVPNGFTFEQNSGTGAVSSTLTWTPNCDLLGENFSSTTFPIQFLVWDDNCPNEEREAITVNFEVTELTVDYGDFLPPNAFTPNGDGRNDTYTLSHLPEKSYNLPPDNCADQFQSIIIFDRNGGTVFQSSDREFIWTGSGVESGVYYYQIDYLNNDYKGTLTLIR